MRLRLRQHKRIAMGRSAVSGWGAFLVDGAKRNELLDEVRHPLRSLVHLPGLQYTGELITQAEADRRGRVYDISDASFLFMLSATFPPETLVASPR
jgi:[histone H3]-lysine27 N-trimethyltransferase EZH2